MILPPLLLALLLQQSTPTGGAIAKYVPPAPTPASFISDQADVIPAADQAVLDDRIRQIQRDGFGDIAVAILPSIGDYGANDVAVEIYRTWKVGSVAAIGSAHRNVGVLLLIVPKELAPNKRGECWINPGTGAEGIITDATAAAICRDSIIPRLKRKDYSGAVSAGILGIEGRLRADAGLVSVPAADIKTEQPSRQGPIIALLAGIVSLVLVVLGLVKWQRYRTRRCRKCGRPMRRLSEAEDRERLDPGRRLEEELKSVDYDVWVCECGEQLVIPYRAVFTHYSNCRQCGRRTTSSARETLIPATTMSSGSAEDHFSCANCGATWTVRIVLPMIVESSGSSSDSGSGGGGSGGDSFGGSGSDSGGGGGSSY